MRTLSKYTDAELLACYTGAGQTDGSLRSRADEAQRQEAFRLLVLRHGRIVMSACRSVLHSDADAEDAFQATFFVLARKAGSIESGARLAAWLHRAALRIAIRAAKRNRKRQTQLLEAVPDQSADNLELVSTQDRLGALHEAVGKLAEPLRSTVLLTYFEGLTRAQTADRLGVTEHVIHGRLKKARGQLRRMLARNCVPLAAVAILVQQSMSGAAQASVLRLGNCCAQTVSHVKAGLVASATSTSQFLAQGVISTMTLNSAMRHASVILLVAVGGWLAFGLATPHSGNSKAAAALAIAPAELEAPAEPLPASFLISAGRQDEQSAQAQAVGRQIAQWRQSIREVPIQILESLAEALRTAEKVDRLGQIHQIGIAVHNFHDVQGSLPPGKFPRTGDEANRPLLSWRVYLLPYLGNGERELFEKFHLGEPWDSNHNKQLLAEMPEVYALNKNLRAGMSDVQSPFGPDTFLGDETTKRFASVNDGISLTAMFFEVAPQYAVPWTKPDDFEFDPEATNAMQRFGQPHADEILVGWGDAGTSTLPKSISAEFLQSIINCADGSPRTLEEIRQQREAGSLSAQGR